MTNSTAHDRIADNVARVRATVAVACRRAARDPADVRLVAVTKYVGLAAVRGLIRAGIGDLGESRVQQLMPRVDALGASAASLTDARAASDAAPRWHLIGHLQRNKVKYLLPRVRIIHSVDSARLARQLVETAAKHDVTVDALLEVNVAGEASKDGVSANEVVRLIEEVDASRHLRWCGLMTMAPLGPDAESARPCFATLRELLAAARSRGVVGDDCRHLSMGMSGDYAVAVEEGATLIRVGSALFEGLSDQDRQAD